MNFVWRTASPGVSVWNSRSLVIVMSLLLTACTSGNLLSIGDARQDGRPNILIILTDDQRLDSMQVMPKTRRWFSDGVKYTNAFTVTPMCCQSRASLFTGRYAHNHKLRIFSDVKKLDHETTLQFYLQRAGYQTAIVGKYLNRFHVTKNDPLYFDRWAAFPPRYRRFEVNVDGTVSRINDQYSTSFLEDSALRFLRDFEESDQRPWLLYVMPFAPHVPAIPDDKYASSSIPPWKGSPALRDRRLSDEVQWLRTSVTTPGEAGRLRARQLRTLLSVDDLVDELLTGLQSLGEESNTLAFFSSDSGFLWAEHGQTGKRAPYTESLQIPLLARWPERLEAGTDTRLVGNVDIAPTILRAARVTPEVPMDGISLWGARRRKWLLAEQWVDPTIKQRPLPSDWALIRSRTRQFIEYYRNEKPFFRSYYNLGRDPWQLHNLVGDERASNDPPPAKLLKFERILTNLRGCRGSRCLE